ncbi:condensation domain-containing protein [Kitasatospora sp. NBC_00070]|uniref:condensation domain-containing protein n=1 Tax=Kitasatospora sp. NBC_00070 TaxID=2975962 RepID=UPI003250BEB5
MTESTLTEPAQAPTAAAVDAVVLDSAAALLGVPVLLTDNFFAQGGSSLMAARLATQLGSGLGGVEVSLDDIFEAPVLGELAERLRERVASAAPTAPEPDAAGDAAPLAGPVEAAGGAPSGDLAEERAAGPVLAGQRIPLTYSQERRRERDVTSTGARIPHHITEVFEVSGELDTEALGLACHDLVDRHPSLRALFASDDAGHHASLGRPDELDTDRLFRVVAVDSADAADRVVNEDATRLFQLDREVKLRVTVLRLPDSTMRLVVTVEHLVSDGESFSILLVSLADAYRARLDGRAPDLGAAPTGSLSWGETEHHIHTERLATNLAYWRGNLDPLEALPEMRLPGMHEPTAHPTTAEQAREVISSDLVERLREWCAAHGCTLYGGFLSALALSSLAHSGRSVIGVVSPTSVRPAGWDGEVAWFATSSIFRFRINSELPTSAVLRSARTSVLSGMAHAMPLPLLVNELQPGRDTEQLWRPWLYLDVSEHPGGSSLSLAGARVSAAEADLTPALRPGVAIGITVEPGATSVLLQYEAEAWSAQHAQTFVRSLVSSVELLLSDLPVLECARVLRARHHFHI